MMQGRREQAISFPATRRAKSSSSLLWPPKKTNIAVGIGMMIMLWNLLRDPIQYQGNEDEVLPTYFHPMDKESYHQRMAMYRERYGYSHPMQMPRRNGDNSELCGMPPDYAFYFAQNNTRTNFDLQMRHSANGEDLRLYNTIFQSINSYITAPNNATTTVPPRVPVYMELGANNGHDESNTRFFDECLGWDGILIEGYPPHRAKLLRNRPNAHIFSFAPTCNETAASQNTTVAFADFEFLNSGLYGKAKAYDHEANRVIQVPCGPLTPILWDVLSPAIPDASSLLQISHQDAKPHIDFFSLDVEGSEPLVVKNIAWDQVQIDVVMIENWNTYCKEECASRDEVQAHMRAQGYIRFSKFIVKSDVYVHPTATSYLEKVQSATNSQGDID